jgi:pyrroloquinoline quinone (PQQ) biosynthesis protein C
MMTQTHMSTAEQGSFSDDLIQYIQPYRQEVIDCRFLSEVAQGVLSVRHCRAWVSQQYHYVHQFPGWLGMTLHKVDDADCRKALLSNLYEERSHPALWMRFATAWGLSEDEISSSELCPEMQALNDYLGLLAFEGSAAECGAALCMALEGISRSIIEVVSPALFKHYNGRDGINLDKGSLAWLTVHSDVDPQHGHEGATLVNRYATNPELRARSKFAARRALEFLRLGFDGVHRRYRD